MLQWVYGIEWPHAPTCDELEPADIETTELATMVEVRAAAEKVSVQSFAYL